MNFWGFRTDPEDQEVAAAATDRGESKSITGSVCSTARLLAVSVRGIAGDSQLHLSADHFSQKVDLVRLTKLTHCQIHLVDKLCIRRQKRHGLPACPKPERQ
jgi:hypothetical protein